MGFIDDLQSKAYANSDGKVSIDDLNAIRNKSNGSLVDQLKEKAHKARDGRVSPEDAWSIDFGVAVKRFERSF